MKQLPQLLRRGGTAIASTVTASYIAKGRALQVSMDCNLQGKQNSVSPQ